MKGWHTIELPTDKKGIMLFIGFVLVCIIIYSIIRYGIPKLLS